MASPPTGDPAIAGPAPISRPASASTLPSPRAPKPPPIRQNNARRLIVSPGQRSPPTADRSGFACIAGDLLIPQAVGSECRSIYEQEFISRQQGLGVAVPAAQFGRGLRLRIGRRRRLGCPEIGQAQVDLTIGRGAAVEQ